VRLEDIDRLRRRPFGAAAVTLAAVRLGPPGTARAQAAAIEPALFGELPPHLQKRRAGSE